MMVGSRLGYAASLLLAGPKHGAALRILDVRVAYEPQTLERERIKVNRSPVNGDHNSELAISARHAGTVALQLLFREQNRNDPVARLWFDIEQPSMAVTGRSAELLFGLVTYLRLGEASLPEGTPKGDFMATGALDGDGNVGSVEAVATKINAALVSNPSVGTRLFYPRADEAQIDEPLRQLCRDKGLLLCPVSRIDEALDSLGVPILGSWPSDLSPFRSLEAFDSRFSRVFFGRQREVEQLLALLDARAAAGKPGALVIGASGAGKSSFCLAGLVPALVKQKPGLRCAVWRPRDAASGDDDTPTDEAQLADNILAQWQARDESQNGLSLTLPAANPTTLDQLAKSLTTASADVQIFIVDQFEELFTLAFMPEARIAFGRFLLQLQARGVWIIGTLRSEFYAQYLEMCDADGQPVLTPIFEGDGQYNLPRMSRDSFAQVIMRPAELAGLKFEQRPDGVTLAQSLLADAMSTEDALPLLGFALQKLYDESERPESTDQPDAAFARMLGFASYKQLGGLAGAIGTVAAEAYSALDTQAQAELPELLNALAAPSADGTRETARPVPIDQWPLGTPGRRLINALTSIRVLVSEQSSTSEAPALVRVSHEALFSHWELAAQHLNDSHQNRSLIEDFRQRASRWEGDGRPRDALLSSKRDIENARAVQELVPTADHYRAVAAFMDQSMARARQQKHNLYTSAASVALALIAVTAWALTERAESIENESRAISALSDVQEFTARTDAALSAALRDELEFGQSDSPGEGAAGIILDADTGAVLALVSLSSSDPNGSNQAGTSIPPNRALKRVYEFGSAFMPIVAATIIDADAGINLDRRYPTSRLSIGSYYIRDAFVRAPTLTLGDSVLFSSNVVIAQAADQVGREVMQRTMRSMNLSRSLTIGNIKSAKPLWPNNGGRVSTMVMANGHGFGITPLHLASAFAAVINGGIWRPPTLATTESTQVGEGQRVFSPATSKKMRQLLRRNVIEGTGFLADIPGLSVGGKGGMAEKAGPHGYSENSVTATFVGAFPMERPKYVVLVMFDGLPTFQETSGLPGNAIATTTARRVIQRIAPLLGVHGDAKLADKSGILDQ